MKIKALFATRVGPVAVDLSLLLVRVVMGAAFMMHGWSKIQTPFSWMPMGSPVPGFFQALAALSEFGGGLALILGLLARLGALGLFFTMIVATYTVATIFAGPFVDPSGSRISFELPLMFCVVALFVSMNGPGRYSLDRHLFGVRA